MYTVLYFFLFLQRIKLYHVTIDEDFSSITLVFSPAEKLQQNGRHQRKINFRRKISHALNYGKTTSRSLSSSEPCFETKWITAWQAPARTKPAFDLTTALAHRDVRDTLSEQMKDYPHLYLPLEGLPNDPNANLSNVAKSARSNHCRGELERGF